MTFYSGQNGRMTLRTGTSPDTFTTLAKVTNWQINVSMSALTTTTLEDTDNTYTNGIRNTTGTCRLFYYDDTSGATTTNSCSTLINKLIKERTAGAVAGKAAAADPVTFRLEVVDGNTIKRIEVEALLTSAAMTMAVGQVLAADVSFQVNGAVKDITL